MHTKTGKQILDYENMTFLPKDVTDICLAMLYLKASNSSLAQERAAPRKKPSEEPTKAQVVPLHAVKNVYAADSKVD